MNTHSNAVNVLHTDHSSKTMRRVNPYTVAVPIIMLIVGASYYFYQHAAPKKPDVEQISKQGLSETIKVKTSAQTKISTKTRKQQTKKNTDLKNSLANMQASQLQRDTQIKAYLQAARAPERVPDLPVIAPLETPQTALNLQKIPDQYDMNRGQTLPKSVMDKFTTETGLTQAEIEQAMNQ